MNKAKRQKQVTDRALRNIEYHRRWRRNNVSSNGKGNADALDDARVEGELLKGAKYFVDIALNRALANDVLATAEAHANARERKYVTHRGRVHDYREHGLPEIQHDTTAWPLTEEERYPSHDQITTLQSAIELLTAEIERLGRANNSNGTTAPYAVLDDDHLKHQIARAEIASKHQAKIWRKMNQEAVDIYPVLSNTVTQTIATPVVTNATTTTITISPSATTPTNFSSQLQSV